MLMLTHYLPWGMDINNRRQRNESESDNIEQVGGDAVYVNT